MSTDNPPLVDSVAVQKQEHKGDGKYERTLRMGQGDGRRDITAVEKGGSEKELAERKGGDELDEDFDADAMRYDRWRGRKLRRRVKNAGMVVEV